MHISKEKSQIMKMKTLATVLFKLFIYLCYGSNSHFVTLRYMQTSAYYASTCTLSLTDTHIYQRLAHK